MASSGLAPHYHQTLQPLLIPANFKLQYSLNRPCTLMTDFVNALLFFFLNLGCSSCRLLFVCLTMTSLCCHISLSFSSPGRVSVPQLLSLLFLSQSLSPVPFAHTHPPHAIPTTSLLRFSDGLQIGTFVKISNHIYIFYVF